jgi:P-type Cu+ transporter
LGAKGKEIVFSESGDIAVKDPVCGETLGMAEVAGSEMHEGWAYYFCSSRCRAQFARSPVAYAQKSQTPEAP